MSPQNANALMHVTRVKKLEVMCKPVVLAA